MKFQSPSTSRHAALRSRLFAMLLAMACTLPAQADVILPTTPLQAGATLPANVLFVLDDSGSMGLNYMPDTLSATATKDVSAGTYTRNGIFYNPDNDYTPWRDMSNVPMTLKTYNDAYSDSNYASGSVDLFGSAQTYYIPKPTATAADYGDALNYYRYQIQTDGTIYRSELLNYGASTGATSVVVNLSNRSAAKNTMIYYSFSVPPGTLSLTVQTSGGTGNVDLYLRKNNLQPTTGTYDYRSNGATNTESLTVNNPTVGTWWIGLNGPSGTGFSGVQLTASLVDAIGQGGVGCDSINAGYEWRNCQQSTPTGRSEAAERQNFATWYSYYRTRIKTAKAAAGSAFSELDSNMRVGFRTIWNRNTYNIPVGTDNGLFRDLPAASPSPATTNRSTFFSRLYAAAGSNSTPLRVALDGAGQYFKDTTATGPYGPESGVDQISCRQNFTILTTDGYWNETFTIADQDNTAGATITGPNAQTYTYSAARPYSDAAANTLADVAMKYWKTDLRTEATMVNNVPTSTSDPAFWQHMVTFGISIGAQGVNASTQANLDQITAGTLSWPATSANALGNIDDLWHASVNGRGKFIEASDPDSFVSGLRNALATIAERTSSSSNVAANSTRLDTGTQVFQANFITGRWTGDLISYPVSAAGVGVTPTWRASQNMPVWSSRNIITWNTASNVGSDFPTAAQQTALGGVNVTNYLRGNQTLIESNGGPYRNRLSLLGDIDHSSPIFVVGDTTVTPNIPAMVYVGGNDGMLHAFNASTGVEVFGYIPGGTNLATLKTLSDPDYQHAYFVDGELAISSKAQTPGQNILVGVMGRGGKTVYAIDVTDPANVDETKVLWEYSNAELGNVLGKPIIAKINDSSNRTGVLIGNGFNSASGHSALFVLDIATGTLIKKLDPAVGNTTTLSNGMSTPRGWDIDRSGTIDEVYAGDLLGNIWKFDLSSSTISNWDSAFKTGSVMNPFYSAKDALGNAQPITGGLSVGLDPNTFARWVFFGTGRYLTSGDPASQAVQTWYGMMDASAKIATNNRTTNDQLKERKTKVVTTQSGKIVRAFEEPVAGDMTGYKGWYVDLVDSTTSPVTKEGERIITDSVLIGGVLIAASIIPTNSSCDVGGRGFINAIDPFTGGAVDTAFFDLNGDGSFDKAGDTLTASDGTKIYVGSVDLGVAMPTMPAYIQKLLVAGGSSGTIGSIGVANPTNSGRISWREVLLGN